MARSNKHACTTETYHASLFTDAQEASADENYAYLDLWMQAKHHYHACSSSVVKNKRRFLLHPSHTNLIKRRYTPRKRT
jgi:hypothetical protein